MSRFRPLSPAAVLPVLAAGALLVAPSAPLLAQDEAPDTRPGVAVVEFFNGGSHGPEAEEEDFEALEVGLQQMLITELALNTNLRIVERARLREAIAEQDLVTEDRVDPSTAVEIGRIVNARYVVQGTFTDLYGRVRMDARIFDTETTETLRARRVMADREEMYDLLVDLSVELTEEMDLPALPQERVEERKEREIPPEAMTLYSRAQVYEDSGFHDRAVTLYRQITEEFPEMVEARAALEQLSGE
jgi:TolB-like protein